MCMWEESVPWRPISDAEKGCSVLSRFEMRALDGVLNDEGANVRTLNATILEGWSEQETVAGR